MTTTLWPAATAATRAPGVFHGAMTLLGVPLLVSLTLARDEFDRRRVVGLDPLLSHGDLTALAELPVDIPVPAHALPADTIARLRGMAIGAVDVHGETVTRRAVSAVRVRSVVYEGAKWSTALERASRFAPYAQRTVVLPHAPRNSARIRTEAAYYGVGVRVGTRDDGQWLAHPAPFRPRRYSPASWLFDETVLAAMAGTL